MRTSTRSICWVATLTLLFAIFALGSQLLAQDQGSSTPQSQSDQQAQPQQPRQAPDQSAQAQSSGQDAQAHVFSGTIVRTGTKYQLQDASGKMYDLDHQDLAQQYEGKEVRVKGELDPDGKTIHVK